MLESVRKSMCIISFSPVARDARILRQIKYLSPHYDLTVIGFGQLHSSWSQIPNLTWKSLDPAQNINTTGRRGFIRDGLSAIRERQFKKIFSYFCFFGKKAFSVWALLLGRILPGLYESWYWLYHTYSAAALDIAIESKCHIFYANDWNTLPIAVKAAGKNKACVVFDAHEYGPLEYEERRWWRILMSPAIHYILKKYSRFVDASLTVVPALADRYRKEFKLSPIVVMNVPDAASVTSHIVDPAHIRLIYHGAAGQSRPLERMIRTLALCDRRYTLHLMLVGSDPAYIMHLERFSQEIAPGRVFFEKPVPPDMITSRIAEYDICFCLLEPLNYNTLNSLPNKFLDGIVAGLAVCIGPLPSMVEIVQRYGLGGVAPTSEPQDVADMLNRLTPGQIEKMKAASRTAAKELNADTEMKKLIELLKQLN